MTRLPGHSHREMRAPQAGVVIFVDTDRDHSFDYIEVAASDVGEPEQQFIWGANVAVPGTGTAIGTGAENTERIIAVMDEEVSSGIRYSADEADRFVQNGFDDWHLPSKDELNLIHELRDNIEELRPNQYYASSSDDDRNVTWVWTQMVNDSTGRQANSSGSGKITTRSVRAVRYFSESDL